MKKENAKIESFSALADLALDNYKNIYIYIYIYIYICVCVCVCVCIYIYIYIYMEFANRQLKIA